MSISSLAAFPDYPRLLRGRKQRASKSSVASAPANAGASLQPPKGKAGARKAAAAAGA